MASDDEIRDALQRFSEGDYGRPDLDAIRTGHRASRRYGTAQTLLAVAVLLLIAMASVVLITQVLGGDRQQVPITPTPSPSQSSTPQPDPTPTPAPSSPSPSPTPSGFPVNPGSGINPGPVAGVGDTIAGLRLDSVKIRPGSCGTGATCPAGFTMTLTNTTDADGNWQVFAYTYRNGTAELGNATQVTLTPGETGLARITMDTSQAADGEDAANYSWNWSAVRQP